MSFVTPSAVVHDERRHTHAGASVAVGWDFWGTGTFIAAGGPRELNAFPLEP